MHKLVLMVCVSLWSVPAVAGWDEAQAAYKKKDYKTAAREIRKLAEKGDPRAQVNLGSLYENGQGVKRNERLAVEWYAKAAEQGDVNAQYNLGQMYLHGQGVLRSEVQALKWTILAAQTGDKEAAEMRNMMAGNMSSDDIEKAKKQAREWYAKHSGRKQ